MSAVNAAALLAAAGGDYTISRSVRLRSSATAYLNRTPASASNRQRFTWSGWVKRGALSNGVVFSADSSGGGTATESNNFNISFTSDTLTVGWSGGNWRVTSQVFRDPSAWYHLVVAFDTTQATAANRVAVYVNGSAVTAFSTNTAPTLNVQTAINNTVTHRLGNYSAPTNILFDGYLTEVNFIDGQALTASSFGETDVLTGVWKPKRYAGTYGTNGFYLNFSDNSAATAAAIGKDYSGNGNNWTPNNISVTAGVTYDSMLDVPTPYADGGNGRGNYAVLNPLKSGTNLRPDHANLFALMQSNGSGLNQSVTATIYVSSGKWYWEGTSFNTVSGYGQQIGIASDVFNALNAFTGSSGQTYGYEKSGLKYNGSTSTAYGAAYTSNDVIGVALDLDAGTITFYKNGVTQGTAFTGISGNFTPFCGLTYNGGGPGFYMNFGQRPFAYTPPTGFKALNTQNLPDATIKKGNQYFDATLATGNNSTQSIINAGSFQPDLVWMKIRSGAENHILYDAVRGVQNYLVPNLTSAEGVSSQGLTAFNSNGFTLGNINPNYAGSPTFVAWQWKESASAGFDIVTYTAPASGAFTVNHSLGVAPAMVIAKTRGGTGNWGVWHKSLPSATDSYLNMNLTSAVSSIAGIWGAGHTSTVTGGLVGSSDSANTTAVRYLFAEVAGFSAFGKYTGNGSADGPFVYCGFRPRYVMVKRTDAAGYAWVVMDSARNTYNAATNSLTPSGSDAEYTNLFSLDLLSNGFKWRSVQTSENASGGTYIFAAFAENPFKNSLAR